MMTVHGCRALMVAASVLLSLVPSRSGRACDWQDTHGDVLGVARDGNFISYQTNLYDDRAVLLGPQGTRRAWCTRNNEADTGWECHGEKAFRPTSRRAKPFAVARHWAGLLGGTSPLSPTPGVPVGVTEAFCSRIAFAEEHGCDAARKLEVLSHPSSPLVFFRYDIRFHFCGGPCQERNVLWLSRPELARRLRQRAAIFSRQPRRRELQVRALEALIWTVPEDSRAAAAELQRLKQR